MDSYDSEKLSVDNYFRISLFIGFSALPAVYVVILHDAWQYSLPSKEIKHLQYHMKLSLYKIMV